MIVWIVFAVMAAAAVAAVLRPLAGSRGADPSRAAHERAIYRDQLGELERDLARGVVAPGEAEAARAEIARRLIAASENGGEQAGAASPGWRRGAAIFVILTVPAIALGAYLRTGSPDLPRQPFAARQAAPVENQDLPTLVARVERHLQDNPTDAAGWDVIGPAYMRLRQYSDAADAFGRAIALGGETAQRLSAFGEARMFAAGGMVDAQARAALEKAVQLDPAINEARYYLGLAAVQDGDIARAAAIWEELVASAPPGAPWVEEVSRQLAAVRQTAGVAAGGDDAELPGPSQQDIEAAGELSQDDQAAMIEGMVAGLAERLGTEGGSVEEWVRLARAYVVLERREDALAALKDARKAYAGNDGELGKIEEAARELGLGS